MAAIVRPTRPLTTSPLDSSATLGAALAFLGLERATVLLHGAQGCTAFGKVFFVGHFREPIPLHTTAIDQIAAIMGADENLVEGLRTLCQKHQPALIGVASTSLAETEGADLAGVLREFRNRCPEHAQTAIVAVNAPDYAGCFESGYAAAVERLIVDLVPERSPAGPRDGCYGPATTRRRVNVLAGPHLTTGDVEALVEWIEAFELEAVVVPNLADSLDGHLLDQDYRPLTYGGTRLSDLARLGEAAATFVVGASLERAADRLHARTGVPDFRFDHLLGLEASDSLTFALHRISGRPVPRRLERERSQLQDALVDTHFVLSQRRLAVAGEPDLVLALSEFAAEAGLRVVAAAAAANGPALERLAASRAAPAEICVGDLRAFEHAAREGGAELIAANAHAADLAARLAAPLVRVGFPQHDRYGGCHRRWIGYRGARQALFDLANALLEADGHEIPPYRSRYSPLRDADSEVDRR